MTLAVQAQYVMRVPGAVVPPQVTAGASFSHQLSPIKRSDHILVTKGIYRQALPVLPPQASLHATGKPRQWQLSHNKTELSVSESCP